MSRIIPPEILIEGYANGVFPMADDGDDEHVHWYTATQRGIIPLEDFKVSSNVRREIRKAEYTCKVNTAFKDVVKACADRETTWINELIINSYSLLNEMGFAHSVEIYNLDEELVGGLYGVSLGAVFFGESMFKKKNEYDKIALYHCHQILLNRGYELWDTQFYTDHLGTFGAKEIMADEYSVLLAEALRKECIFKL